MVYRATMAGMTKPSGTFMLGHVAVRWKDCIVVFSQTNSHEIWMYNLWAEQWTKYTLPQGKCPVPVKYGQRGVEIESEIYMFGGFDEQNMLWKLKCQRRWCSSKQPRLLPCRLRFKPRDEHTGSSVSYLKWKSSVAHPRKSRTNSCPTTRLKRERERSSKYSLVWKTIKTKDRTKTPSPRAFHCAWKYDEKMWIFGGYGDPPIGYLNDYGDFTRFDSNEFFNNQLLSYDPFIETWTNVRSFGDVPAPRAYASSAIINSKVYLHGGGDPYDVPYRDHLYELDMQSFIWTRIETTGLRPNGQDNASLTPATFNQLVFYGKIGFQEDFTRIFDVQSHTWKKHLIKKTGKDWGHTGTTGLHGSAIILGEFYQSDNQAYDPVITVRIEPKSLQQLAKQKDTSGGGANSLGSAV